MNIYEQLRAGISVPAAAARYGLEDRRGMARCPFHPDRSPSMKLYEEHYHCFACGAHGDVTALTARLLGLGAYEAAQRLAGDFGLTLEPGAPLPKRARAVTEGAWCDRLRAAAAEGNGRAGEYLEILTYGSCADRRIAMEMLTQEDLGGNGHG